MEQRVFDGNKANFKNQTGLDYKGNEAIYMAWLTAIFTEMNYNINNSGLAQIRDEIRALKDNLKR